MTFPAILKAARKRLGWTLEELATVAGMGWRGLSRLERGQRDPKPATIAKLSAALDLTPEQLMGTQDLPPAPEIEIRANTKWKDPVVQAAWESCMERREKRNRGELPALGQRRTPEPKRKGTVW